MIYVNSKKQKVLLSRVFKSIVIVCLVLGCNGVFAIDNPDAQDLVAEFEVREKPLIAAAENETNGYRDNLIAYTKYIEFLDKELNTVYKNLSAKLPQDKQQQLKESQINWLKYRDLEFEFEFIENTWTKSDFGSSSSISRGQYKVTVVRNRVIQLMHYSVAY